MFDPDCGIDEREARERARRRGRAYQCMTCHYREGRRVVDIKCRIEEHILKMHVALENVPYYCCLCLFKGQRKEQLLQHFKTCKRHRDMAEKRGIEQGVNETLIVQSSTPHRLSAVDYVQLSAEESLAHFMNQAKSIAVAESRSQLATTLNQMFPGLIGDGGMQCTTPDCMTESEQTQSHVPVQPSPPAVSLSIAEPTTATNLNPQQIVTVASSALQPIQELAQLLSATPLGPLLENSSAVTALSKQDRSDTASATESDASSEKPKADSSMAVPEESKEKAKSNSNSDIGEIADQGGVIEIPGENELVTFTHPREEMGLEEEEKDPLVLQKVSKKDETSLSVDVERLSQANMVTAIEKLTEAVNRSVGALEKLQEKVVDNSCLLAKVASVMMGLKGSMEANERLERHREEVMQEFDRRRENERRRQIDRRRKEEERHREEQRRAVQRREEERRAEEQWRANQRERDRREQRRALQERQNNNRGEIDRKDSRNSWRNERRDKENQPKGVVLVAKNKISGNKSEGEVSESEGESK